MDETKVQIGDDVLLDIGTHSDWYISVICYDSESVNVELRRKINRNNKWWIAEQIESQTGQPCDGCEYSKPYIEYKCTHHSCKFEDEPLTADYCDTCDHKECEYCIADSSNPYCVPSNYHKVEDEPTVDYNL